MANYSKFDVFDLELGSVSNRSELWKALVSTKKRSILVLKDIDCIAIDETKRKVISSAILDFIDGFMSCSLDERIIVFTTNHKNKLDPALLRPGRMDMHIDMSI